jgi:hypothetical protein
MPNVAALQVTHALTVDEAERLLVLLRASTYFRQVAGLTDLEARVTARILRSFPITGVTGAPAVITATEHDFAAGDRVIIADVLGATAVNGRQLIAAVDADAATLTLRGVNTNAAYVSGGTVTDYGSGHLSAIVRYVDLDIEDGTVGLRGGKRGVVYSQVDDKDEAMLWALSILYGDELANEIRTKASSMGRNRGSGSGNFCVHWP